MLMLMHVVGSLGTRLAMVVIIKLSKLEKSSVNIKKPVAGMSG